MTSNAPVYNLQNGRLTSHTLYIFLKSLLIRLKAKQAISLEGKCNAPKHQEKVPLPFPVPAR